MFHLSMAIASYRSFGFAITRIWQPDYLTRIDRWPSMELPCSRPTRAATRLLQQIETVGRATSLSP